MAIHQKKFELKRFTFKYLIFFLSFFDFAKMAFFGQLQKFFFSKNFPKFFFKFFFEKKSKIVKKVCFLVKNRGFSGFFQFFFLEKNCRKFTKIIVFWPSVDISRGFEWTFMAPRHVHGSGPQRPLYFVAFMMRSSILHWFWFKNWFF